MPDCPAFLSAEAQAEWGRFTKELLPLGLVTPLDRTALIVYCDDFSMLIEAGAMVRAKGLLIKTNNGNPIQNPYLAIANSTKERLLKVLEQFGGTPSARTRIHAAALPGDDAEEKDMFGDAR
jgi:P27 family predicted phage terminase small subunit